ncbi:MAG: PadR family transcriptional regulator [Microbacteriaceae bacterium]|nr:PadR family transcriptional regulator [Microbacteriaceae bacterium]
MSLIQNSLLSLAAVSPAYGLQLSNELTFRTGRVLNSGQVYTTLPRAEEAGLLAQVGETHDGLALYETTEAGNAEVALWFKTPEITFDDLVTQVRLAHSLPGVNTKDLITLARHAWRGRLVTAKPTDVTSSITPTDPGQLASATLGFTSELTICNAALGWLEDVERLIADSDAGWVLSNERPKRGRRSV